MAVVYKTVTLPNAIVGVPYEAAIGMTVAGAVTAFALSTGTLPPGLAVSSATDARIVGTPTSALNPAWVNNENGTGSSFAPNQFNFTLTANDGGGAVVSGTYTILVFGSENDGLSTANFATPGAMALMRKLN